MAIKLAYGNVLSTRSKNEQRLTGRDGLTARAANFHNLTRLVRGNGNFHLHGLDDNQFVAGTNPCAGPDAHIPDTARDR